MEGDQVNAMSISSVDEAWRRLSEVMTYLESRGELERETRVIRGTDTDCQYNNRDHMWELYRHMGMPDGN